MSAPLPGRRAIILTRVSTASQQDNTSHQTQQEHCERYCAQEGFAVVLALHETVSGALYVAREETQKALSLLESDYADYLILYDMTRYGRDVEYQQKILKRIVRAGKRLQFATFPLDYDEHTGELTAESEHIFNTLGGGSSYERATIKRRMRVGKLKKVAQGIQPQRAQKPYGYHVANKNDVIRGTYPPDAEGRYFAKDGQFEHLITIFETYDREESLRAVIRALMQQGIPSPSGAAHWRESSLQYILRNPVAIGKPTYGRHRHLIDEEREARGLRRNYYRKTPPEKWHYLEAPRAVSDELFFRVQNKLETGRALRSGRSDRKYMLTGLLVCPECGFSMCGHAGKTYYTTKTQNRRRTYTARQYKCRARYSETMERNCMMGGLHAERTQTRVVEAYLEFLARPELLTRLAQKQRPALPAEAGNIPKWKKELAALDARERAAAESRIEAKINGGNFTVYDHILSEISARRKSLKARIDEAQTAQTPKTSDPLAEVRAHITEIRAALESETASDLEKNRILCSTLEAVRVTPDAVALELKHTDLIAVKRGADWHIKRAAAPLRKPKPTKEEI